jgi:hypothetical protein
VRCASASGHASWKAEAWLEGRGGLPCEDNFDRSSIVIKARAASNGKVDRFLMQEMRKIGVGKEARKQGRFHVAHPPAGMRQRPA